MLSAPPDTASASRGKRERDAKAPRASLDEIGVAIFTLVYAPRSFAFGARP